MKNATALLSDLCDIRSGGTPSRDEPTYYGGSIPWVKIADLNAPDGIVRETEERITQQGLDAIRGRIFPTGAILLAMYGSIGKIAVAGAGVATNQAILGIQVKEHDRLDVDYLRRWLISSKHTLEAQARGVTQKNISATIVRELEIPLPPFPEQRRIAAILDKADAIRRKRLEAIGLVDELVKSAFLHMFGDPISNPRKWPLKPLGSVGNLDRGRSKHRPRNDPALLGGNHPLIQTGEVANCGGTISTYTQTYSDLGLSQSKMWPKGTLCITIAANIAKTGVLGFDAVFPTVLLGSHLAPTRKPNMSRTGLDFYSQFWNLKRHSQPQRI